MSIGDPSRFVFSDVITCRTAWCREREHDEVVSNVINGVVEEEIDCLVPEDQREVMKQLREVTGEHNCLISASLPSKLRCSLQHYRPAGRS